MVNDFLPPRRPRASIEPKTQQNNPIDPNRTPPASDRHPAPMSPQLTRAQPFMRPDNPQFHPRENPLLPIDSDDEELPVLTLDNESVGADRPPEKPTKRPLFARLKGWWLSLSKKKKILLSILAVGIIAAVGAALYFFVLKSDPVPQAATVKKPAVKQVVKPVITYSTLTGLPVDPTFNQRPVTGVMIENSLDARPQSGLNDAGVVFEAIAEGGITRFLTLFQDTEPDYIGPVRSVRPYYIQWAAAFNASIAHVGGSGEALQAMKDWKIRDLDQFAGAAYFSRITSRYSPHNVYTSIANLRKYGESKGYTAATYTGFVRNTAETKPLVTPKGRIIDMKISGALYNANYTYDAASNTYLRKVGGAPHLDEKSKKQLAPKVVVGLVMPYSIASDGIHSSYQTFGSGKVYIFQGGDVIEGTWHKADRDTQFTFTDAAGKAIKLNPGQTWLTAVGTPDAVTYAP